MRTTTTLLLTSLIVVTGCATAGSGEPDEPLPVPVYREADAVPCAYEVMTAVEHRMTVIVRSGKEYYEIRDRELARMGDEVGADAVIVAPRRFDRPLNIAIESPMTGIFEGLAIRFTDEECAAALEAGGG